MKTQTKRQRIDALLDERVALLAIMATEEERRHHIRARQDLIGCEAHLKAEGVLTVPGGWTA